MIHENLVALRMVYLTGSSTITNFVIQAIGINGRFYILTLFRMNIFGAAHGWGEVKKTNSPKTLSHISCIDETWHSCTLLKEDPKKI